MNELKELQSIMKLLKKYELPISPILEYAIEEKIDQISLKEEAMSYPSATVIQESDKNIDLWVILQDRMCPNPL